MEKVMKLKGVACVVLSGKNGEVVEFEEIIYLIEQQQKRIEEQRELNKDMEKEQIAIMKEHEAVEKEWLKKSNELKTEKRVLWGAVKLYEKDVYEEFCEQNCQCRLCTKMRQALAQVSKPSE